MPARSRDELAAIIRSGESVMMPDGRCITKLEDLPDAVDLAGDDIIKRQQAIGDLEAEAAALNAKIAAYKSQGQQTPADSGADKSSAPNSQEYTPEQFQDALSQYATVGPDRAKALVAAGFDSKAKVDAAADKDLLKVEGFDAESVKALRLLLNPIVAQ